MIYQEFSDQATYSMYLRNLLIGEEGVAVRAYMDTAFGTPRMTIGYGFNIQDRLDLRDAVLSAVGFREYFESPDEFSEDELAAESFYYGALSNAIAIGDIGRLDEIMDQRSRDQRYSTEFPAFRRNQFSLGTPEAQEILLNYAIPALEERLSSTVGGIPLSVERAVLASLEYNGLLANSPNLLDAIRAGDRVNAWFEIRYLSNRRREVPNLGFGVQGRRFRESNLFGLWDNADISQIPFDDIVNSIDKLFSRYDEVYLLRYANALNSTGPEYINLNSDFFIQVSEGLKIIGDFFINFDHSVQAFRLLDSEHNGKLHESHLNFNNLIKLMNSVSVETGSGNDVIFGSHSNDIILSGLGNDTVYGFGGNDSISVGSDVLISRDQVDINFLYGGKGFDTYIIKHNSGKTYIDDEDGENFDLDFSVYAYDEIEIVSRDPVVFRVIATDEKITISNPLSGINSITFSDRKISSLELGQTVGTDGNDIITPLSLNGHKAFGGKGDDLLIGGSASDYLDGQEGDDRISGGKGNDTLVISNGNDFLVGGPGDDRYKVADSQSEYDKLSGAQTTIIDNNDKVAHSTQKAFYNDPLSKNTGIDTLDLEYTAFEDLSIKRSAANLIIEEIGGKFKIVLADYFLGGESQVEWMIVGDETISIRDLSLNARFYDYIDLSEGNDEFQFFSNDSHHINTLGGADSIFVYSDSNLINLGDGNDKIVSVHGNNILAGEGDDEIVLIPTVIYNAERNAQLLDGGEGDDTFVLQSSETDTQLLGGDGSDVFKIDIHSYNALIRINGGNDDDYYVINSLFNTFDETFILEFQGEFGNDTINSDFIIPRMLFTDLTSADQLEPHRDGNNLALKVGDNMLTITNYFAKPESIRQEVELYIGRNQQKVYLETLLNNIDDEVYTGNLVLRGYSRLDDILSGYGGDDQIFGYDGNDQLNGNGGNDSIFGGQGNDKIYGGDGDDIINGGAGNDHLDGGSGNDLYNFGIGDGHDIIADIISSDVLRFESGLSLADLYFSRDESNANSLLISFSNANDSVLIQNFFNLILPGSQGNISFEFHDGYVLDNEVILAQFANQFYEGDDEDNHFVGLKGDDVIFGYDGNDFLFGFDGNDIIFGGKDNDHLDGGAGADQLFGEDGDDIIFGGQGADNIAGGMGNDQLDGGDGNDIIYGEDGADTIYGGGGEDRIWGGSGSDLLKGGSGNDYLEGEAGNDLIFGDDGDDQIFGGSGSDEIFGGSGNDFILGGEDNDYINGGTGDDVYWFSRGDGKDTVIDPLGYDQINFYGDLKYTDLIVKRSDISNAPIGNQMGDSLLISVNSGESIELKNVFIVGSNSLNSDYLIENFIFSDGRQMSFQQIISSIPFIYEDETAPDIWSVQIDNSGEMVSGYSEGGAYITVTDLYGNLIGSLNTDQTTGFFSVAFQYPLLNGELIYIQSQDFFGNISGVTSIKAPDHTAPAAPTANLNSVAKIISGVAESSSTVTVRDHLGQTLGIAQADSMTGEYSIAFTQTLIVGESIYTTSTDSVGNVSAATPTLVPITTSTPAFTNGLRGSFYGYHQPANGNVNLTNVAQVLGIIASKEPDATFVASRIQYSSSASLGMGTNLQTFLNADSASLSRDPADTSDAIIRLDGKIQMEAGNYNFRVRADDGYSLRINGAVVAEHNANQGATTRTHAAFAIGQSGLQDIEIIYWDANGGNTLNIELRSTITGVYKYLDESILFQPITNSHSGISIAGSPLIDSMHYFNTNNALIQAMSSFAPQSGVPNQFWSANSESTALVIAVNS